MPLSTPQTSKKNRCPRNLSVRARRKFSLNFARAPKTDKKPKITDLSESAHGKPSYRVVDSHIGILMCLEKE